MIGRILALVYGIVSYAVFFITFLYFFAFTGDLGVPKSVSVGVPAESSGSALALNLGLILLFGIQHSVMARPTFKKGWTKWVPRPIERSTYVLLSNAVLILLYWAWQPMPAVIWNSQGTFLGYLLLALFFLGMLMVLISSFMIDHFDLFGLRQTYLYFIGKEYTPTPFKVTGLYKFVRHPLMLGFLIALWAAPVMTTGRLLFAAAMTFYIFLGIYFEERNTAEYLGEAYVRYRKQTSMVLPLRKKK